MPDIVIYRGKNYGRRYLFPETERGKHFLRNEMAYVDTGSGEIYVAINSEHLEEIINLLEENELHVEESKETRDIIF